MKVVLYMATTLNGYIARKNNKTDFVSEIEWDYYKKIVAKIGNIVIGRKTYEVMKQNNEFSNIINPRVIVLNKENKEEGNITFTNKSPKEVITILNNEGFETILIAGGGKLNSTFIKENLIDEVYIDIEPKLIGKGIKLFADDEFDIDLELIETNKLSNNEIQLHYKIVK